MMLFLIIEMYDIMFVFRDVGLIKSQQTCITIFVSSSGFSTSSWNFWPWPDTDWKTGYASRLLLSQSRILCSARVDLKIKSTG